ncbi:hypothetical protein J3A83DRAFT_4409655 [Scleroderma citrinum]
MPPSLPAPHYNVTPASEPPPSVHSQHHPTPLPHALPYSRPAVHVPSTWNKDAWSAPPTAPPAGLTPAAPPPVLMSQPSTPLFLSDGQTISTTSSIFDRPISQDACVQDNSNNVSTTSIKHHHHYSSSTSSGSTPLLPQKKHVLTAFSSPDHYQLKEVLQLEGASEFDVVKVFQQQIVQVDFYPILTCSLNELISTQTSFDIQTTDLFSGNIRLDLSVNSVIGRPYIDNIADPGPPFIHLTLKDESKQLYTEANALYWAKSLLQMTYEFVDTAVKAAQAPPPFQIPCLHFVDAGLLLAYEPHVATVATAKPPKPGGTVSTMFLAEELIPASEGDFMKYIHNSDATPCDLFDTKADKIAQFLSFTQHVQYSKTGGQVYISDYQGSGLLLTDPQILTHP